VQTVSLIGSVTIWSGSLMAAREREKRWIVAPHRCGGQTTRGRKGGGRRGHLLMEENASSVVTIWRLERRPRLFLAIISGSRSGSNNTTYVG